MIRKAIWSILCAITVFITTLTNPVPDSTAEAKLISNEPFLLNEALVAGQGITNDGKYYYSSGCVAAVYTTFLAKFDMETLECVEKNVFALPFEYLQMGYNHIGGISYYNGKIYASVEGDLEDGYIASIMTFDAKTLKFDGGYYPLPKDEYDDGVPWCAVDGATGLLYASKWSKAERIHIYDTNNNMAHIGQIEISGMENIDRIQGAEVYNGYLYLSNDCRGDDCKGIKKVLKTDISTGFTQLAFTRNTGTDKEIEAEGMTVKIQDGKPIFCVLDYNRVATVFLREYTLIESDLEEVND